VNLSLSMLIRGSIYQITLRPWYRRKVGSEATTGICGARLERWFSGRRDRRDGLSQL